MARDLYAFNPMWLSPELDLSSEQNIVEMVPVSQFRPYVKATYGTEIPQDRADRLAADTFFDVATAYSTDESLDDILKNDDLSAVQKIKKFIPRWLQLAEPVVDATRVLDKSVARHLAPYDDGFIPSGYDHDLSYMVGLAYMGTQLSSVALDIPHPSQSNPDLSGRIVARGDSPIGGDPDVQMPQTLFLGFSIVKAEHRKRVEKLRADTERLNARAQKSTERLLAVMSAVRARRELMRMLAER
jgi:hypothetical protein